MSLVGPLHCFRDELLDEHQDWLVHALSGYAPHIEGTIEAWLERIQTDLTPLQRVKLLTWVAYRYTGWDNNVNAHVTTALFRNVNPTYAFLVLVWWLCTQHNHRNNKNNPSDLLHILLETHANPGEVSMDAFHRLSFRTLYAHMFNHWGRPGSSAGKFLRVLALEDTSYHPTFGGMPEELARNWDTQVCAHLLVRDQLWQTELTQCFHNLFPDVLAQLALAYLPPCVLNIA